jgi:hypothetical protein
MATNLTSETEDGTWEKLATTTVARTVGGYVAGSTVGKLQEHL